MLASNPLPGPSHLSQISLLAGLAAATSCSLLIDRDTSQCESPGDCSRHPGTTCDLAQRLCLPTNPQDSGPDVLMQDVLPPDDGTDGVSVQDQVSEESSDTGHACTPARPPAAPTQEGPDGDISLTAAIMTLDFGDNVEPDGGLGYLTLGYDLDGLCSTSTSDLTCQTPTWATGGDLSDGEGGRDNSVGRLLYKAGQGMLSSSSVNQAIADGELPLGVIRVLDYSGEPDDEKVQVEWYQPAGSVQSDGGARGWLVAAESSIVSAGDAGADADTIVVTGSKTRDSVAYVKNGTFVARFPDKVTILLRETPVDVLDATVTGALENDSASKQWIIRDAVIVGRVRTSGMLGLLPSLMYKILHVKVCTDSTVYAATKQLICSYADFVANGPFDSSRPCDALSVGIGFSATPGVIVGSAPGLEPKLCPDATDPRQDTCIITSK